jgi:hypothetical protein
MRKLTPIANRQARSMRKLTPIANRQAWSMRKLAPIANRQAGSMRKLAPIANRQAWSMRKVAPIANRQARLECKVAPIVNRQARLRDYRFRLLADIAVNCLESLSDVRVASAEFFGKVDDLFACESCSLNKLDAVLLCELAVCLWVSSDPPAQRVVE